MAVSLAEGTVLILAKKIQKIQMIYRSLVKVLESSIKKDGKEAYIVTNNHVVDGAKNLKSCFRMVRKLLVNLLVKTLTLT